MSKRDPVIQKFMSTVPYSIPAGDKLKDAIERMDRFKIRHLPVMDGQRLVGIISDRDVKLACGIEGIDPARVPVLDVCSEHPYAVDPETPLREVAAAMASKQYGSALVVQNGKLVGIFTTVDACRALVWLIETRMHAAG